jgi:hypothetical protein
LLFHDPVRTARVNSNKGAPFDLPAGTAFGGTVSASDPNVQEIVNAERQTGSCGSCHIGEASAKAGQLINFNSGGEGRCYTDEHGNFFPRRRPQSILTKLRTEPTFPGDALVDAVPTLTDIYSIMGQRDVTTPARAYHLPVPDALIETGRLDELDSVARQSPSLIGFAFNNRLLFDGLGGEPQPTPGSLSPLNDPAGENITLLLLDAHRIIGFQSAELLKIPAFVKLFRDAFPEEAAQADAKHDLTLLVNDQTEFRAQATFLRTVVTRNTPFDKFVASDDRALTPGPRRGAELFFTPAAGGAGGAGCFTCHSGPMLNKQTNDPDVAGIGAFVEENFFNVGIGDHPVQALNALARGHLDPAKLGKDGFPHHAEDTGRQEVTHNPDDAFKFRALTLRQLKDARTFFHNGSFTKVRDVVEYFNAGVPQDATAGGAPTLSARFTNPRGPGYPRGLGLGTASRRSRRLPGERSVRPCVRALRSPVLHRYLAAERARSHLLEVPPRPSPPWERRTGSCSAAWRSAITIRWRGGMKGSSFLDVTSQASVEKIGSNSHGGRQTDQYRITNRGQSVVDTHLLIVLRGLPRETELENASGTTRSGDPYIRVFLPNGVLQPGQNIIQTLIFSREGGNNASLSYVLDLLSGQGNP